MIQFLSPLEQLYELNREIYTQLDDIQYPLIVVGGQAIHYWLDYYEIIEPKIQQIYSVDIDYVAKLDDIRQLNQKWKSQLSEASDNPPPSLALILLENDLHQIKQIDGALFIDIDKFSKNEIKPNLIDFIDRPKGFSVKDLDIEKGLTIHTVPFKFPPEFNLEPHQNLRILTPIACLKSRLANYKKPPIKPPKLERMRIQALMNPISYYLQDQLEEIGFRNLKKQINLLIELIETPESIELSIKYNIHLLEILNFLKTSEIEGLPEDFVNQELTKKITHIESRIQKINKANTLK